MLPNWALVYVKTLLIPPQLTRNLCDLAMNNSVLKQSVYTAVLSTAAFGTQAATVDFSNLVANVSPAVVSVSVTKKMTEQELLQQQVPELLRRFFGPNIVVPQQAIPQEKNSYGTAFFVDKNGYLLTNHHVIENASKVTITLNDRREIDATVVGSDERTDVALLKVKGNDYPELKVGNVDQLRVGEAVLAIGSPFGFDYSASAGIVSAKMRNVTGEHAVPFIQTDVAMNPGNSGGPLFNQRGEVVGVNSRIFSGTGGYMGLSFSIPIDVAMDVAEQLKKNGRVIRSYLGVQLQDIDRTLAESYRLAKPEGALITQVTPNSPAARAGLRAGDVILQLNGNPIRETAQLLNFLNRTAPQQVIELQVLRNDQRQRISAMLSTAPDATPAQQSSNKTNQQGPVLGIAIRNLSADELRHSGLKGGVLVQEVSRGGIAAEARIQAGDIITALNNQSIQNSQAFIAAVAQFKKDQVVRVSLMRKNQAMIVGMRIR